VTGQLVPATSAAGPGRGTGRDATSWGREGGDWSILVHGGAGDVASTDAPRHARGCLEAARAGAAVLRAGGHALDAVERAVCALEDDPVFNAGVGACLNEEGLIELDASLMEGTTLRAGGVGALPPFAHPIAIARAVLEEGRHVLYCGEGAAQFARRHGFLASTSVAMTTEHARARWLAARAGAGALSGPAAAAPPEEGAGSNDKSPGTVGAVARDARGCLAAATSTGGRLLKAPGRVGDSPIPGAGNYADDRAGAASATGNGEAILRVGLTRTAVDLIRAGLNPTEAARAAVHLLADRTAGTGGIILVDPLGRLGWARTTATMSWAAFTASGDASGV
jgi:beta-aspartyl-peptidase (threonine type)